MAIINQTFTMAATGAGTVNMSENQLSWCKLTDTRMVVCYYQTNPFGRRFAIVDNPDGLNSATTPTFTSALAATGDPASTGYPTIAAIKMERINYNTFMVMVRVAGSTTWSIDVFTVTGTVVTFVHHSDFTLEAIYDVTRMQITNTSTVQNHVLVNAKDNVNWFCYARNYYDSFDPNYKDIKYDMSTGVNGRKMVWNPANNTMATSDVLYGGFWTQEGAGTRGQNYYNTPYGSTYYPIDMYQASSSVSGQATVGFRFLGISNDTNRRVDNPMSSWLIHLDDSMRGITKLAQPSGEACMMSSTRRVEANWSNAYFFSESGPRRNAQKTSGAPYPITNPAPANDAPFVFGIDENYLAVMSPQYFFGGASTIRMKIVRRDDANMLTLSNASAGTYGMTITPPVKVNLCWDKFRPFMLGQDIMWVGKKNGTPNQFSYNIIKQPPLVS